MKEYTVLSFQLFTTPEEVSKRINNFARDGWRVVAANGTDSGTYNAFYVYLERDKPEGGATA